MKVLYISHQPVELYKILKLEGLASSGGEAKAAIADGRVRVNDTVETRKRRKIVAGDTVSFGAHHLTIRLEAEE